MHDSVAHPLIRQHRESDLEKDPNNDDAKSSPGALLMCQKQRNGEWGGKVWLWFDLASMQFFESSTGKAKGYVPYLEAVSTREALSNG